MAQQELDLVQCSAGEVAQTSTGAPKIVRRQLVDAGSSRRRANDILEHLGRHAVSPRPAEREAGLRTVPSDELANGVVVGPLPAGRRQAVQHRGFRL